MKSTRVYGIKYDMKSTRAFKILSIALAAAVVFYFLVQGVRYLTNPYATTRVYTSTTEESVEASGWLVREEEAFRSEAGTLSHTRDEGEKVGKGQVIATAYDSPGALEAVAQIQAKRLQLEQLEYALSSYLNPDAALKLDGSISDEIMALRKNLTGGDYTVSVRRLRRPVPAEGRHCQAQPGLYLQPGDQNGDRRGAGRDRLLAGGPYRGHGYHRSPGGDVFRRVRRV